MNGFHIQQYLQTYNFITSKHTKKPHTQINYNIITFTSLTLEYPEV